MRVAKDISQRLAGRTAIVTGAGRGLGRAYALRLASEGAAVVVNDVAADSAASVVEAIEAAGGKAIADAHSVTDPAGAAAMVASAIESFGSADILVCNAGIVRYGELATSALEDLHAVIDVSLWGSVHPIRAAWPHMVSRGFGRIILTSSQAGLWGYPNSAAYAMAKAGIVGLGRVLAQEAPAGCDLKVNIVAPCAVTAMSENSVPVELHDIMSAERVAPFISFLASEDCRDTGLIFNVGGSAVRQVRILESGLGAVPLSGIDSLPPELADLNGPPEPRDMLEAGPHIIPALAGMVKRGID